MCRPLNVDPMRITNALSLWLALVLVSQLPILLLHWLSTGQYLINALVFSLCLSIAVPLGNHFNRFQYSRALLLVSFGLYVCVSALVWEADLGTQYFLLLGVFTCPFIFFPHENRLSLVAMLMFICLFLLLESYFVLQSDKGLGPGDNLSGLKNVNTLLFSVSVLVCSFYIQRNAKISWLKQHSRHQQAQKLLENTFPKSFVDKLQADPTRLNEHIPQVTVLFADMQGFTSLCQQQSAQRIVSLLDDLYTQFDAITRSFGLEKIKTIGDEYMAVSGAPVFTHRHAEYACQCALEMQKCFSAFRETNQLETGLRIGLASGNVVAGMIGQHKYSYDVWGNAVNLAARMQKLGETGKIQVSQVTAELAMHLFSFSLRGEILVKGLGKMKTYWLIAESHDV